jgi:hypothetical protein
LDPFSFKLTTRKCGRRQGERERDGVEERGRGRKREGEVGKGREKGEVGKKFSGN